MEKINSNLLSNIKQKLFGDPIFLAKTRLSIAKTVFIFMAFIYFFAYLLVIGGFQVAVMNHVVFFLYPLFAFATLALLYNIIRYAITVYFEKAIGIIYIIFIALIVIYCFLIAAHIGLFNALLNSIIKLLPFTL